MQYEVPTQPPRQRLARSTREKMISGVSGGLAEYFDLDPVVVRLIWIAAGILTAGLVIPVYGVMWMIMPRQDDVSPTSGWRSTATSAASDPGVAPGAAASPVDPADPLGAAIGAEPSASGASSSDPSIYGSAAPTYTSGAPTYGSAPPSYTSAPPAYGPPPPAYTPPSFVPEHRRRRQKTAGVILIALGLIFMGQQLGIFSWYAWRYFWPVVLIAIGSGLLLRQSSWRR
jgi:phage shock protein C